MDSKQVPDNKIIADDRIMQPQKRNKKQKNTFYAIGTLAVFAIFIAKYFRPVVVSGPSMLPTLHNGEWLTVSDCYWLFGKIRHKDIVVFKLSGQKSFIIKRVYKFGGETVPYVNAPRNWSLRKSPYVVPMGDIYVLGDNRPKSEDSRYFGPVPLKDVIGKVIVIR